MTLWFWCLIGLVAAPATGELQRAAALAAGAGVEGVTQGIASPPRPEVFGVASFEPLDAAEDLAARALATKALAWLGVDPARPPVGARMAYRLRPMDGPSTLWRLVGDGLDRSVDALVGEPAADGPISIEGTVRTGVELSLELSWDAQRLHLAHGAGVTLLQDGVRGGPLAPRAADLRFARRRVRNFHPGAWLTLGLGPGGRLRLPGPEPGHTDLARLLVALPDGEAMEYLVEARDGALRAERAFVANREWVGMQTTWFDDWRPVAGVRVAWVWIARRAGRPAVRGQMRGWAWLREARR